MSKIIVENNSVLTDGMALYIVGEIIIKVKRGKSEKQNCYSETILVYGRRFDVCSFKNKESNRFVIEDSSNIAKNKNKCWLDELKRKKS